MNDKYFSASIRCETPADEKFYDSLIWIKKIKDPEYRRACVLAAIHRRMEFPDRADFNHMKIVNFENVAKAERLYQDAVSLGVVE
jgi:hypothetical protein